MKIRGNVKIILEGRGPLILRPGNYKTTGGEGSIFQIADTAVKLYTDKEKMKRHNMVEKIKILSSFQHKFIVAPQGIVNDDKNKPIGFYMPFVKGEPLPRIFTNEFRKRIGFTDKDTSILVNHMRNIVLFAHEKGAVLVDPNELSWLIVLEGVKEPEPRIIDVDSWAIGKWPPSVIMLSIRDWHSKEFNQLTDWFAWGIVTFQIYTGIHPYKGYLEGYKQGDFIERMKDNKSVFTPGIRLNRVVRDFSCVPGPLLDWYMATFENGERVKPPSPFDAAITITKTARIARAVITASGILIYEQIFSNLKDCATKIFPCGVAFLDSCRLIDLATKIQIGKAKSHNCEIISAGCGFIKAELNENVSFSFFENGYNPREQKLSFALKGYKIFRYQNRLFVIMNNGLTEVALKMINNKPVLSVGQTWGIMINSTEWFDGVGVLNAMGAIYLILPFKDDACAHIRVRELDRLRIITAKAGNRFASLAAIDKDGSCQKLEFAFNEDYDDYKCWTTGSDNLDLNLAILPKGVCATIIRDGELDIFVPSNGTLNKIADKDISTDMVLSNWNDKVVYIKNGEIWSLKMK